MIYQLNCLHNVYSICTAKKIVKDAFKILTTKMGMKLKIYAERKGFEPSIRCRIHTFQACSFNHSDTSLFIKPKSLTNLRWNALFKWSAKIAD